MIKMVEALFQMFFFVLPFVFFPGTSEVFEFNKIVTVYVFTILIVSAWAIKSVINQKYIFRRTKMDIPLLLFLGSQALSAYFSIDSRTSIFGYYSRFNGGLVSIICYSILYWAWVSNVRAKKTKKIMQSMVAAGLIISVWAILEHYGYSLSCLIMKGELNTACWKQDLTTRVFATLGQPNWLAAYLAALAPLGWSFLQKAKRGEREYYIWLGAAAVTFAAIVFTKSRSGILGYGIAFGIYWAIQLIKQRKARKIMIDLVIVLFMFWGLSRIGPAREIETEGLLITPSSEIRKIVWKGAFEVWREYPLLGSGVETFGFSYFEKRPKEHNLTSEWNLIYNKAHNEYLNYLATTGIFGLGSYLLMIFTALIIFVKGLRIKNQELNTALLAGYVSILVTNFFGFSVVVTATLFYLLPAMATSCKKY